MTSYHLQNVLFLVYLSLGILAFIVLARRGLLPFLRRIAGLESIEEAVGRATELGRPVLFTPGLEAVSSVRTLAAISVLTKVIRVSAQYTTRVIVTVSEADTYSLVKDVVRQVYAEEGKPELYREEDIHFLSANQFSYASATAGIMHREKVGAAFFFGSFAAEALIMAEAGNQIRAVQVSATTSPYQIPFFVATCDYTLIGEELFAASAYLTKDPTRVGSLIGQDIGKIVLIALIGMGVVLQTVLVIQGENPWIQALLSRLSGG